MATFHRHMTQRVKTDPYWQYNCSAYSGAMLINDSVLGGLLGITGRYVREHSSEPKPDPSSPGLNIGQIRSVATGLRVPIYDQTGQSWTRVVEALRAGRRVLLQVDYGELPEASKCQAKGDFGHAIVLVSIRADGIGVLGSDPLCSGTRTYTASQLQAAARKFANETGVTGGLRWAMTKSIPATLKG